MGPTTLHIVGETNRPEDRFFDRATNGRGSKAEPAAQGACRASPPNMIRPYVDGHRSRTMIG